uniref:Uncharacterized protein n=1 Tax=Oryza brachyantha TaxID=4533 RepID=J3LJT5_ORYBR
MFLLGQPSNFVVLSFACPLQFCSEQKLPPHMIFCLSSICWASYMTEMLSGLFSPFYCSILMHSLVCMDTLLY